MPANKYALIRYRVIDECLSNPYRPYPSKEDLRRACEDALYGSQDQRVSVSTIEKDLYAMRNDLSLGYEAPIAFHKGEKGYYYSEDGYTIKKVPLGEDDMEALRFASQTLYQFKDLPMVQSFQQMIGKLREQVSLSDEAQDMAYVDHMIFDDSHRSQGDRYLPELLKAIRDRERVGFHYEFHDKKKEAKCYLVEPYLLKQFRSAWYLIAMDPTVERVKTFGLDRMSNVERNETLFLAPGFHAKDYYRDTFGISHLEADSERILLEVDAKIASFLLAAPFHESMKKGEERGDVVQIELELVINQDLVNELMSWMPHIRIKHPARLRNRVIERCKEAISRNLEAT